MTTIITADIGGTHARFAVAEVAAGGVASLSEPVTLKCAEYASLQTAWDDALIQLGVANPGAAAIALATPIRGEVLKMTNNPWIIRPALIPEKLGVDRYTLVNDFGAVGHAVQACGDAFFEHLTGADAPLPDTGVISIIGPGTGLGVAYILRSETGYHVVETEGGHMEYSALDTTEDAILARLRKTFTRVSVERVVSGPGLVAIYEGLAAMEHKAVEPLEDKELWTRALEGSDHLAAAAFDRFCLSLGSAAGDFALAQGASAVVIAGGLGYRIREQLKTAGGFADRFTAKGRFQHLMETIPVKLITHEQPGLFGAAAAFAQKFS